MFPYVLEGVAMRGLGGLTILLGLMCCRFAATANAADSETVAVLGLRAPNGDDRVARNLSKALRKHASEIDGWKLHAANVSLEQLMLVNECDRPDNACMKKVAASLKADRVISGSVSRVKHENRPGYDYRLNAFCFVATTGLTEKSSRIIDKTNAKPARLLVVAKEEVARFAGKAPDLEPAERTESAVEAQGPSKSVLPMGPPTERIDSEPRAEVRPWWPAAVSYGASATFLGLTVWSWASINSVENDPDFQLARTRAGPGVDDVCSANTNFGVEDLDSLCSTADRHETLQWVFLSAGLATAGLGTWLLVRSIRSKKSADRADLRIAPAAGRRRGGVTARLRF